MYANLDVVLNGRAVNAHRVQILHGHLVVDLDDNDGESDEPVGGGVLSIELSHVTELNIAAQY